MIIYYLPSDYCDSVRNPFRACDLCFHSAELVHVTNHTTFTVVFFEMNKWSQPHHKIRNKNKIVFSTANKTEQRSLYNIYMRICGLHGLILWYISCTVHAGSHSTRVIAVESEKQQNANCLPIMTIISKSCFVSKHFYMHYYGRYSNAAPCVPCLFPFFSTLIQ